MMKKTRRFLTRQDTPIYERSFVVTSLLATIVLSLIFIWDIIIGESFLKLLSLGVTIVVLWLTIGLCLRFKKVEIGGIILSAGVVFFVLPIEFFTGGGVYGCTPIWFAYAFLFVSLNIKGKLRFVFIGLLAGVAIACYSIAYYHPKLLTTHTAGVAYLDSIASLIGVGVMLWLTMAFLMKIFIYERNRAEKQAEEINEMNRAQSHFFSSMSHEIRTPINTIIGLNEMILREDVSQEVAEDAANIQSAGRMLLSLVNDILDMSKIESGRMDLTPVAYHTGDMLSEIVNMLWKRAKDKGLELKVDVAPDLPGELKGDEVRIKQILINVLNNSIKYTREGTVSLSIQCEKRPGGLANVVYSIADTGIGIKQESMPYLFTAFKRVDEEKNRHIEGTGLGLAIVKQLVDQMGGRITVNSVYTKGTTFIIEIPQQIIDETALGEYKPQSHGDVLNRQAYHASFTAPDAHILVVDDNVSNLMVVEKLLRETKVQIDTARSGKEALEKMIQKEYPVIFMDHLMPEMDGVECLHELRVQMGGLCKESKVVALTANAGSEMRALYEKEGFDGYLLKPVSGDQLERELYRQLPKELVVVDENQVEIAEESVAWMHMRKKKVPIMITTESVADLPADEAKELNIAILPHHVITDDGKFDDGEEIEARGLIAYMQDPEAKAETAAPDVETHENFFAEMLTQANNIVHISISSRVAHSGCIYAREAARSFENVNVVDSRHLSSGQGLLAIEANRMAQAGCSVEEITKAMTEVRTRIHSSFIVDDMDYLARAGQIPKRVAGLAKAFMIHPEIVMKRGKMGLGRFYVGSRESVWRKYIRTCLRQIKHKADRRILFVTFVELTTKEQEWIRQRIEKSVKFDRIIFQKASPAIAVNSGPGTFGLLYMDEEQ